MRRIIESRGRKYRIDFPCIIEKDKASKNGEGKTLVEITSPTDIFFWEEHYLQVYYRHERTLDDHMGNTPCGYYVNVPLPTGETKRIYMF